MQNRGVPYRNPIPNHHRKIIRNMNHGGVLNIRLSSNPNRRNVGSESALVPDTAE